MRITVCIIGLLLGLLPAFPYGASLGTGQKDDQVEVLLQSAINKEMVEGNLEAAIELYKKVSANYASNRPVAARALLHLAGCYEKLGLEEARKTYQQLVNDFPDQEQEVAAARQRLAELAKIDVRSGKPRFRKIQIPVAISWKGLAARLSPDGRALAFSSQGDIWVIPVSSKVAPDIAGEPRRLTEAMKVAGVGLDWSKDGKWIAFNAAGENGSDIYVVPSQGGKPVKYASRPFFGRAYYPYSFNLGLSPDGAMLAFASKDGEGPESVRVHTVLRGATSPKAVTKSISAEPAFSPDGGKIAYVDLGRREIRVIPAGGGESMLVAGTRKYFIRSPVWSPDGRMVAYLTVEGTSQNADELWIVPVSETGLGTAPPTFFRLPRKTWMPLAGWTLDNRIGLIMGSPVTPAHQALYTVPASGGKATQITPSGPFESPRWSPDGESIWFENPPFALGSVPSRGGSVSTIPTGTSPRVQEVPPGGGNIISPDGKSVVFAGYAENANAPGVKLWVMPLHGAQPIQLTAPPVGGQDRFPCWSHDGKSLLFIRVQDWRETWYASTDIYMMPAGGGEARRITSASDAVSYGSIACSPDGKWVAYFCQDPTLSEDKTPPGGFRANSIKIKPSAGGASRIVARVEHGSGNEELSWSPDGTKLAYNAKGKLWVVSPNGGEPVQVETGVEATLHNIAWSPDGQKLAFRGFRIDDPELWLMEDFLPLIKTAP